MSEQERRALDLQVIAQLRKAGDDLSAVRRVDHFAYFGSEEIAEEFVHAVARMGLAGAKAALRATAKPNGLADSVCVEVNHMSQVTPETISRVTVAMDGMARELGGEYDGWGCGVVDGGTRSDGKRPWWKIW